MKNFLIGILICFLMGCTSKPREMGSEFAMFGGYYFFGMRLTGLKHQDIPNKDTIWFGHLDVKTSKLELIDGNSWNVVKVLEFEPYKGNVFSIIGFDNFYVELQMAHSKEPTGQHTLSFIRDKDNPQRSYSGGYFVHELKSVEDCKKFLADWKAEVERTNCEKESCYGN
ncbi:hypothetical protein EHQ94_12980 [Leptospira meyeri]|uniref:hypothetical protein n=1 Tax=Leptospira meyeri TaxID=29508 RepID=UPI0010828995|nr:hypothetical protein [Leptospira meyeri]TGM63562.1 hypothetical protein EHQ94_12980 [Leptospira meyeri]TGM67969.1 hypothetical protein EHQ93_08380 [Leptospira meyeri]